MWKNFMVTSAEHSWVNPINGAGFGSDSDRPTPRPVLSSVYRSPPLAQDLSPGLLLRGLTTQQNTVRSVAYPFYPSAGTLTPIAYNQHIPNLVGSFHQYGTIIITVPEYKKIWMTMRVLERGILTTDLLETAVLTKNTAGDVAAVGLVVTMTFPLSAQTRDRVSFLSCTAEFIHFDHTNQGED